MSCNQAGQWIGLIVILVIAFTVYRWLRPSKKTVTTHGSAHWADEQDAIKNNCLSKVVDPPEGIVVGRMKPPADYDPRYRIKRKNLRHILTCAPTGAGKGIGCVIPNLLEYPGSIVCLDVKGENCAVTSRRRRELGQEVHVLDPFGITGKSSGSINVLDWINLESPESVSDSASLVDTLIVRADLTDRFWDDAAAHLLQGLILFCSVLSHDKRHLGTLREILTLPEDKFIGLLKDLSEDEKTGFGLIARAANTYLAKADRERSGVLSVAQQHTAFLDDPRVIETLKTSQIDFSTLKDKPQTVFLAIPPDKLRAYNRYARAVLGLAIKGLLRKPGMPEHPVLFLLDEFAQLGHFAPVEDGLSILRGYGGCFWIFVQDLSQLKAVYPKWQSFLANTALQAFGTQDIETAKYLSDMLGSSTVAYTTTSASEGRSSGGHTSAGVTTSVNLTGRPLSMPDEIRRLSPSAVIVLEQALSPTLLDRLNYRSDPEYQGLFDENPMYRKVF